MSDPTKPPSTPWTPPPEVQAAIKDFFVTNKGQLPSRLANHAYYSEKYALRAREIIDIVLATRKPYIIPLEPGDTIHKLRNQWYEGTRFLRQKLDPDGSYTKTLSMIRCTRGQTYIQISPRVILSSPSEDSNAISKPTTKLQGAIQSPWRDEFLEWLRAEPELESKFQRTKQVDNVILTDEDITWGNQQLIGLESLFIYKFTRDEVIVIRFNQ